jgi:hypothetical protein
MRELAANLIDNALAYTPRGGSVTVRCGLSAQQPFLEVEDSGPEFLRRRNERVFERFYRLPSSKVTDPDWVSRSSRDCSDARRGNSAQRASAPAERDSP